MTQGSEESLPAADKLGTVPCWHSCPVPACCAAMGGGHPSETEICPRTLCVRVAGDFQGFYGFHFNYVRVWHSLLLTCCLRQGSWFCRCQAKAPQGFAGPPESLQAGTWSPCLCITHTNDRNIFPVTLMVQQWWKPADMSSWKNWLKNAAFLLTPTAPWSNRMDTNLLRTITLFSFSKHFFRLGYFSYCFIKQLHKNLHKHDRGAEADTEVGTCQTHFVSSDTLE